MLLKPSAHYDLAFYLSHPNFIGRHKNLTGVEYLKDLDIDGKIIEDVS